MVLDPAQVRRDFPYLDHRLYLNTASTGLAHGGTGRATAGFYEEMYARGYDAAADWRAVTPRVQAQVGRLAGVAPYNVGFAGSTTEALNLLAYSLPVKPGDRVVYFADEFPSVQAAADILVSRGGKRVELAVADEASRAHALSQAAEGSRYVLASHVHWESGTKLDLALVSAACRRSGAMLIVDGIQALGATQVDAALADAYVASTFKWLLSGFGLAVMITSPDLREVLTPVFRGYANPAPSRALSYSHANYPGLMALQFSLRYMEELGWSAIYERNRMLHSRLRTRLAALQIATPDGAAASILSLRQPDPAGVAERLREAGASVEARGACLRISPHFYNNEADIDHFADMLLTLTKGQ